MDFNFQGNIQYCKEFVDSMKMVLLYSHIPAAVITLMIAGFVRSQAKNLRLANILFALSIFFTIWVTCDLLIWLGYARSSIVMSAWSLIEMIAVILFALTFYFTYVFLYQKDLSAKIKFAFFALIIPLIVIAPTTLNLVSYDLTECVAIENSNFLTYTLGLKIFFTAMTLILLGRAFLKSSNISKKLVSILAIGIVGFLFSFLATGYISNYTGNYTYESYGLFGIIIFVVSLAILIVRFQLFNIKLLSAQILVVGLLVLIGSEYLFIESRGAFTLVSITFVLSALFGYFLIQSVKREVTQREQLEAFSVKLQSANEKLKSLDKLKTEFLSLASHQLRSPLTAIKGYSSMLIENSFGEITDQQKEPLNRIFESTNHLVKVVEDLLNISKIEQGGLTYEMSKFDMKKVVTDFLADFSISAANKHLTITYDDDNQSDYVVYGDQEKLRQVILNLIDNSIKYTNEGGVHLNLSHDTASKSVVLKIKDTGIGMDQETKSKLFGKFSRGVGGAKLNTGGSGLGLYLAKQIVEAHKGSINVDSDGEGKGSTFTLSLKIDKQS